MAKQMNDVQKEILKIYKVVKNLCEENHIRFYAIGGTAIGAVRHNGFIPWDDDMDLGIHIDDYEKFKKICAKSLPKNLKFLELNFIGGKIHNIDTTFIEAQGMMDPKLCYGVFLDVFPIIGAPSSDSELHKFLLEMHRYYNKAYIFDRFPEASKMTKKDIYNWRHDLTTRYDISKSSRVVEFASGHWFSKDASGLNDPLYIDFEDTKVPISKTYDHDLTQQYGNYMKLPPVEERYNHNKYSLVDCKKPYMWYCKKIEKIDPEILKLLQAKDLHEGIIYDQELTYVVDQIEANDTIEYLLNNNKRLEKDLEDILKSRAYRTAAKIGKLKAHIIPKQRRH